MADTQNCPLVSEIQDLACVYLPVTNVYEAISWYRNTLGLAHSHRNSVVPGMAVAILTYHTQSPAVFLVQSSEERSHCFRNQDGEEMASLCFAVKDIEGLYARLKEKGVHLEAAIQDRGGCGSTFWFYDPDGNKFDVNQAV